MPWNGEGGGGPWGSPPGGGDRNPWGGRPPGGGGGGIPPDIEELVRNGRERLRSVLPGGFGDKRGVLLVVAGIIGVWALTGIYRVQPDEQGVVLRFGAYARTEAPGLHYHLPYPAESVYKPKVTRVNRIEVGYRTITDGRRGERDVTDESLMLTGDENIIDIDFSVFWVIKDADDFLFKIRDPAGTVKKAAESAMREVIGRTELQPALTEARQQIEKQTHDLLQTMMDEYQSGIQITQIQLQRADPPAPVIDAFNDVQRARSDRERLRNEAEAYRNDVIPRARGDAERLIQEASAYREQVISLAQGDADRYRKVLEGYKLAKDVLAQRMYLETMEEILRGTRKVIIDGSASTGGGGTGVVPFLPLNDLVGKPMPTTAPVQQQTQAPPASASAPPSSSRAP